MLYLKDIVLEEQHFDILRLLGVPFMCMQYCLKLSKSYVTTHANAVVLHKLLEVTFMVLKEVLFLPHKVFEKLKRC